MSESISHYSKSSNSSRSIDCGSPPLSRTPACILFTNDDDVKTECIVKKVGKFSPMIRIIGSHQMDFTAADAIALARILSIFAVESGYRDGDELAQVAEVWQQLAVQCGWIDPEIDDGK